MSEQISLIVNAGSSSIKIALYNGPDAKESVQFDVTSTDDLVKSAIQWITNIIKTVNVQSIGHRIVHGGTSFTEPVQINDSVRASLEALVLLDPEHMPVALKIIDEMQVIMPSVPQIACFDTAFFSGLPRVAQIVALPRKFESKGIQKYGFHGLSYEFLLESLEEDYGVSLSNSRIVCAHLGSGTSLAAIKNGLPIDTSMSVTPASGIPTSNRSGDVDPAIAYYLQSVSDISAETYAKMTSTESGLLGISETTADMYTLLQQEDSDIRSKEAVELYCYEVKKAIGSLSAALGGIDILVFSGGIGEKAPLIRQRICKGLDYLGVHIDLQKNEENQDRIHNEHGPVQIFALHTNEELVIARKIQEFFHKESS